jgi:hypothetical protein
MKRLARWILRDELAFTRLTLGTVMITLRCQEGEDVCAVAKRRMKTMDALIADLAKE